MSQIGRGPFCGELSYAQIHGILLTQERWSKAVSAVGSPPAGYLAFGGSCKARPFLWTGQPIDHESAICEPGGTEIYFSTPDNEEHWVMLVPIEQISSSIGHDSAAILLARRPVASADAGLCGQLRHVVVGLLATMRKTPSFAYDEDILSAAHRQLIDLAVAILFDSRKEAGVAIPRHSSDAVHRALRYAKNLRNPVAIDRLAREAGVPRRTLEFGFLQEVGVPPGRFLRLLRLNGLYRTLRHASPGQITVAEASNEWGFGELGRTAGAYRELFGEYPSETLAGACNHDVHRYAEALAGEEPNSPTAR